jgi:hypothetical protein
MDADGSSKRSRPVRRAVKVAHQSSFYSTARRIAKSNAVC